MPAEPIQQVFLRKILSLHKYCCKLLLHLHNSSYPHYPQVCAQLVGGKPLSNQGEFWFYQKISTGLHKPVDDFNVYIKTKVTKVTA